MGHITQDLLQVETLSQERGQLQGGFDGETDQQYQYNIELQSGMAEMPMQAL